MRRVLLLAATAVLLTGCEHMYGAVDVGLTDARAVKIARQEAARRGVPLKGLRPGVGRFDTGISVTISDPACDAGCLDGLPLLFFIPAGKYRVTHFQDGRV